MSIRSIVSMEVEVPAAADCRTNGDGHGAPPCFDCSICLEAAGEPVVTPCGHLYCRPSVRRWMRSGQPGADQCPVCKAVVSEGRLLPLYCRSRRAASFGTVDPRQSESDGDGVDELCLDVRSMDAIHNLHGQRYGDHRCWVLHSNAGCVIGSAAAAVLPWAFPGGRLSLPPRPVIVCYGQRQRRVEQSLHQIWLFLAVSAVLCFLLF